MFASSGKKKTWICLLVCCITIHACLLVSPLLGAQNTASPQPSRVYSQSNSDLKASLNLAGQNLINSLDPMLGYLPYWAMDVRRDYRAQFGGISGVHNLGRVWDALLRLEHATGFNIPEKVEAELLATTKRFFDNEDHMCWAPLDWEGLTPQFELHSFREHLLALNALAQYRESDWAKETGHKMLETLLRVSRDDCTWDLEAFDYYHRTTNHYPRFMDAVGSNGRLIEALVYYYQTTKDPLALNLANRFARWHLANSTQSDGELEKAPGLDHTHSYLCTLRGLLLFGKLTRQREYVEAVATTYRTTVRVASKREQSATVTIDVKSNDNVLIRIPRWAPPASLALAVNGKPVPIERIGDFALVSRQPVPYKIQYFRIPRFSRSFPPSRGHGRLLAICCRRSIGRFFQSESQ